MATYLYEEFRLIGTVCLFIPKALVACEEFQQNKLGAQSHMATCTPLFIDLSNVLFGCFMSSLLWAMTQLILRHFHDDSISCLFAQSVSDLLCEQLSMSWYIVPKSIIPNYISGVRGFGLATIGLALELHINFFPLISNFNHVLDK
jgi:hypothetical protein